MGVGGWGQRRVAAGERGRQDGDRKETWSEDTEMEGRDEARWRIRKKLCKTPVSYLLRCIKFPERVPVLYKIMLMFRGPLWTAACWSWACVAGRYTECTQWDSAFLLRKTSRHLMMNSLSPNVPPFLCRKYERFSKWLWRARRGARRPVSSRGEGGYRGGGSLCSRLRESIKASTDNYKPAERRGWLIVQCSMPWAQPRGLSATLPSHAPLCGPQNP